MTWVAWRQQRWQILLSIGIVVLLAAVMTFVRFDALSLGGDEKLIDERYDTYINYLRLVLIALPVLLGMFAGAPLFAREIEQGTHVFGLTQSIGRTRWWATKIAVAGVPAVIAMTVLGLVNAWSSAPLQAVMYGGRLATPTFEIQGLTLGAYTVLAFALSATVGLLVRNTLAAMVVTVIAYIPLLGVVANVLRPSYATPISSRYETMPRDAWVVESSYVDSAGNVTSFSPVGCTASVSDCLTSRGLVQEVAFQPDDRFWSFQVIETGVFVALAVALLGIGVWALHKRLRLA